MGRAGLLLMISMGCGRQAAPPPAAPIAPAPAVAAPIVPAPPPGVLYSAQHSLAPEAVTLPAIPDLVLPVTEVGVRSVRELRVRREAWVGKDTAVEGYVTWVYDCVATVQAKTRQSRAKVVRSIEKDPTQCRRPVFYLGETAATPAARSLWIVEVARHPTKAERKYLPQEELDAWPDVPTYRVGDRVLVRGRFDLTSPHGEGNTDGLIVYAGLAHLAADAPAAVTPRATIPPIPAYTPPPPTAAAADPALGQACADALVGPSAVAAYQACRRAFDANPEAIYALWAGVSLFRVYLAAPKDQALTTAGVLLDRARALDPSLWAAHYVHGRVERTRGNDLAAARDFDAAIHADPIRVAPYLSLAMHYHRWGYLDEALAVLEVGLANGQDEPGRLADLLREQVSVHHDRPDLAAAARSLDAGLALDPDNAQLLFARGQLAHDRGDHVAARRDLERALQHTSDATVRTIGRKLLDRIAAEHP